MLPPSHFILCRLLFLYEWCVSSYDDLFITSDHFPPSFLSYTEKSTLVFIIIDISNLLILVFIFDFLSFFLLLKYFFQFNPSILICIYNIFRFDHSTFDFLFFSFVKVFMVLNFILQIKFMIFLFSIVIIISNLSFYFLFLFSFLGFFFKIFMVFNFILQIKFMLFFL